MDWNPSDPQRFNPMDSGTDHSIDIATIQIVDSIRMFLTGKTGARRMTEEEFIAILNVAIQSAAREI